MEADFRTLLACWAIYGKMNISAFNVTASEATYAAMGFTFWRAI